jgi:hypothetical protein
MRVVRGGGESFFEGERKQKKQFEKGRVKVGQTERQTAKELNGLGERFISSHHISASLLCAQ